MGSTITGFFFTAIELNALEAKQQTERIKHRLNEISRKHGNTLTWRIAGIVDFRLDVETEESHELYQANNPPNGGRQMRAADAFKRA